MPLTAAEKRKRIRAGGAVSTSLGRRLGRAIGGAVKAPPLTAAQKYERAVAKMEGKLGGRRKPAKPVKPPTAAEIRSAKAKKLQERAGRGVGLGPLIDALTPKKKKED